MIGFYVHHHGWGHRTRAVRIARLLDDDVVGLGSLPEPASWPGRWVALPPDGAAAPAEPTAGGVLHWAPLDHRGHRERLGGLAAFLAAGPAAMVVDTSAEVALLARLMGVRTAVVTPRGVTQRSNSCGVTSELSTCRCVSMKPGTSTFPETSISRRPA